MLVSLVFWTGMIRETENLFALVDLAALTGLRAGFALTAQSLSWRPSVLDLLAIPRDQGGVFPQIELVLASCGTGAAIESLLAPGQLGRHLAHAWSEIERLGVPRAWWPEGWWATMDAPLVRRDWWSSPKPVRLRHTPPFVQLRYHPARRGLPVAPSEGHRSIERRARGRRSAPAGSARGASLRQQVGALIRHAGLAPLFQAYRPYEHLAAGPLLPALAAEVQRAGFSYMLTKSGFGQPPHVAYRVGDFVALNYTAGQWDGWTPFETVNDLHDLRRAEGALLARGRPGWLLGTIDACLWTFSGELWQHAPRLAAIAQFVAAGGASGRLVNVPPRAIARYARLIGPPGRPSADLEGPRAGPAAP